MKVKAICFLVSSCIFSSAAVHAATTVAGQGRVSMQGAIIDTACAIAVESRDQVIDMETVPLADIRRNGQGQNKSFSIVLVNCVTGQDGWKSFQVTFDGNAEGNLFGISGKASGVGLQITDTQGHVATPGIPLPLAEIIPGNRQLNYNLKLVANNRPLKTGDYSSSIRFRLDYF
nr:fimbrial protein [Pantoea sp. 201603H]